MKKGQDIIIFSYTITFRMIEPEHRNFYNLHVRQEKILISLCIRTVWSETWLATWRSLRSLSVYRAQGEDFD